MKNFLTFLIIVLLIGMVFMSCSEPTPAEDTTGFTTMWYLDISDLDAMADLDLMISGSPTVSKNFGVYIITGGAAQWSGKADDPKNNPFVKASDGNYIYPKLAEQLTAAGFVDDGKTNPFQKSFEENGYQYWTFKADEKGNGVFRVWTPATKLMSDEKTLKDFINSVYAETKSNSKAKYNLMLWNHGGGAVSGLLYDYTVSSQPGMKNQALSDAIKASDFYKAGKKFETIIFDMCIMQTIEDVYLLKDYTKCVVGSETYSTASGYGDFYKFLSANPNATYTEVATAFVDAAKTRHESTTEEGKKDNDAYTWSAIDVTDGKKLDDLKTAYISYIKDLYADKSNNFETIKSAADKSVLFFYDGARATSYDILSVASRYYSAQGVSGGTEKYASLEDAIKAVLIKSVCASKLDKGNDGKDVGAKGLAFFFDPKLGANVKDYGENYTNFLTRVESYFSTDVPTFYKALEEVTKQ